MANKSFQNQQISTLIKKSEFWVGLVTVAVIVVIAGTLYTNTKNAVSGGKAVNNNPTTAQAQPTTPIMTKQVAAVQKITHLANTAGAYVVVEGDNYYKISQKVCGTGKYFLSIQAQNQDMSLHAGDQLVVNCNL